MPTTSWEEEPACPIRETAAIGNSDSSSLRFRQEIVISIFELHQNWAFPSSAPLGPSEKYPEHSSLSGFHFEHLQAVRVLVEVRRIQSNDWIYRRSTASPRQFVVRLAGFPALSPPMRLEGAAGIFRHHPATTSSNTCVSFMQAGCQLTTNPACRLPSESSNALSACSSFGSPGSGMSLRSTGTEGPGPIGSLASHCNLCLPIL
jgi:hypothetical protein